MIDSLERDRAVMNAVDKINISWGSNTVSISGLPEVHDQVERILTPEEEERLLEVSSPYLRNIITIALNTGMRMMEILSLVCNNYK